MFDEDHEKIPIWIFWLYIAITIVFLVVVFVVGLIAVPILLFLAALVGIVVLLGSLIQWFH